MLSFQPKPEWQSSAMLNGREASSFRLPAAARRPPASIGAPSASAIPRQPRAEALAARQQRHAFVRVLRRVAHQVDAVRIGAWHAHMPPGLTIGTKISRIDCKLPHEQFVPFERRSSARM